MTSVSLSVFELLSLPGQLVSKQEHVISSFLSENMASDLDSWTWDPKSQPLVVSHLAEKPTI